jgi:phage repressor protein C with HTH and peptisase S24 domain
MRAIANLDEAEKERREQAGRLRAARAAKGLKSAKEGSAFTRVPQHTYTQHENGTRSLKGQVKTYAKAFQVPEEWLLWGKGHVELHAPKTGPIRPHGYPLIGKVGAGGAGLYEDDYAMGDAADFIEPLPGMPMQADLIVLETDGDSMAPLVFDGDLAFFGPVREDADSLLGKRVMARLADGRKFFKILKRGSEAGLYTLRSLNPSSPDIEDVRVSWVLPYRGSRPRGF